MALAERLAPPEQRRSPGPARRATPSGRSSRCTPGRAARRRPGRRAHGRVRRRAGRHPPGRQPLGAHRRDAAASGRPPTGREPSAAGCGPPRRRSSATSPTWSSPASGERLYVGDREPPTPAPGGRGRLPVQGPGRVRRRRRRLLLRARAAHRRAGRPVRRQLVPRPRGRLRQRQVVGPARGAAAGARRRACCPAATAGPRSIMRPGEHPLAELGRALARALPGADLPADDPARPLDAAPRPASRPASGSSLVGRPVRGGLQRHPRRRRAERLHRPADRRAARPQGRSSRCAPTTTAAAPPIPRSPGCMGTDQVLVGPLTTRRARGGHRASRPSARACASSPRSRRRWSPTPAPSRASCRCSRRRCSSCGRRATAAA